MYASERTVPELIDALTATAADVLGVLPENVHVKSRGTKVTGQYEKLNATAARIKVREHGLTFLVNLVDYLDTGLFLDHRQTRARVRDEAQGRRVLNLFAYTGAFSVYAAAGGATDVVTVDLSRNYLRWDEDNFHANDLGVDPRFRFVAADARVFVDEEVARGALYDLIVLDPPVASVSKRMDGDFDIQRDHVALLHATTRLLAPGGILYFSNNLRTFVLYTAAFDGVEWEEITARSVPRDFPQTAPHRCWRAVRPSP